MAIKCPNCGQVLPKDNAKFCNSCGTALRPLAQNSQQFPTFSEEDTISPDQSPVFGDSVENLPTAHVEATLPKPHLQKSPGMQKTRDFDDAAQGSAMPQIPTSPAVWNASPGDVAQLSTNRLASQGQVKPEDPLRQSEAAQFRLRPMPPEGVVFQKPPSTPQLGARELQGPPEVAPRFIVGGGVNRTPRPPFQTMADQSSMGMIPRTPQEGGRAGVAPQSRAPMSMVTKPVSRQGMSRKRLALVLALLVVLVISGVAAWIIAAKPFAVASITQPWQQFCDSGLGLSGQYPTGWTKSVDASRGVHFSDGTDQFSIVTTAATGQDAATYLRKEASHLGITGLKLESPASFAGTSWQQGQGSLLQTGVTYTETLFVTTHGNQFFTIMQIAPPGTYNEEDATIFSGMRSSLRFSNTCP